MTKHLLALLFLLTINLKAQVPQIINYQSRVAVGGTNFDGNGQFKFALVNTNGSTTYWSNDGTSTAGSQPTAAVTLPVTKGLYSVQLGDTALTNMTVISASVFSNSDVRLRVWFNDGVNGSQLLSPDHRIAAVGYAMVAATASVSNGLKTTGADVLVSSASSPMVGQVLTATSSTAASWEAVPLPKFDRQFVLGQTTNLAATSNPVYVDIGNASITTANLGETGVYMINCRTTLSSGSSQTAKIILNVNGVDIPASEVAFSASGERDGSIAFMANLQAGSVIKLRFKTFAGTFGNSASCSNTQMTIDGVPFSSVK